MITLWDTVHNKYISIRSGSIVVVSEASSYEHSIVEYQIGAERAVVVTNKKHSDVLHMMQLAEGGG